MRIHLLVPFLVYMLASPTLGTLAAQEETPEGWEWAARGAVNGNFRDGQFLRGSGKDYYLPQVGDEIKLGSLGDYHPDRDFPELRGLCCLSLQIGTIEDRVIVRLPGKADPDGPSYILREDDQRYIYREHDPNDMRVYEVLRRAGGHITFADRVFFTATTNEQGVSIVKLQFQYRRPERHVGNAVKYEIVLGPKD